MESKSYSLEMSDEPGQPVTVHVVEDGQPKPVMVPCKNCHGCGTVFPAKVFRTGGSKQCHVCKGKCKVPAGAE